MLSLKYRPIANVVALLRCYHISDNGSFSDITLKAQILLVCLEYHKVVVLCQFFWFWREIVFGVTYVLSVQYSCAVVSVFCCGGKVNFVRIPYSHDRFSKISRTFLVKKLIPYKTYTQEDQLFLALYGSTIIQSRLFLKNIENFVWFPKQYLLGFFFLEKQLPNISDRGFLFLRSTLLLYSLLLWRES